jgi:hypothetical protein
MQMRLGLLQSKNRRTLRLIKFGQQVMHECLKEKNNSQTLHSLAVTL